MLLGTLILGYLVSGIFSNEFKWKADAVYFTTCYGRNKAVASKIKAGALLVSVLYWGSVLICTPVYPLLLRFRWRELRYPV
ncbi:MAG: hypothetical protein J6A48_01270, partial [Clostridia bacterium]|nr:hypothetical protein [Clostridia bacterium]